MTCTIQHACIVVSRAKNPLKPEFSGKPTLGSNAAGGYDARNGISRRYVKPPLRAAMSLAKEYWSAQSASPD